MKILKNYLGLSKLESKHQTFMFNVFIISLFTQITIQFSTSYKLLYIFDNFGAINAGLFTGTFFLTTMIFDFPTGNLSDYIGQRMVLILSFILYFLSVLSLIFASISYEFIFVGFLNGLSFAFYSGTIASWRDNNYQSEIKNYDENYTIYNVFLIRYGVVMTVLVGILYVISGAIVILFDRIFGFLLESLMALILILIIRSKMHNIDSYQENNKQLSIFSILKKTIIFLIHLRSKILLIISMSLLSSMVYIWAFYGLLVIFYFGYMGSDFYVGVFRMLLFVSTIFTTGFLLTKIVKKYTNEWKIHYLYMLFIITFFGGFYLLMYYIPLKNEFNLIAALLLYILMVISVHIINNLVQIYYNKIIVQIVPSEIRSSFYSLLNTLTTAISLLLLPFVIIFYKNDGLQGFFIFGFAVTFVGFLLMTGSIVLNKTAIIQNK